MTLPRFFLVSVLALPLAVLVYEYSHTLPPQITDTPEPLHLKQDEVEYPVDQKDYGQEIEKAYRSSIAPAGWDKSEDITVLEELDSPVSLSVSSSSAASKASRPPFIPHHKVWPKTSPSSSMDSSVPPVDTSSVGSSSKPLFCFLTGTGSRAEARKNYCNSLK